MNLLWVENIASVTILPLFFKGENRSTRVLPYYHKDEDAMCLKLPNREVKFPVKQMTKRCTFNGRKWCTFIDRLHHALQ